MDKNNFVRVDDWTPKEDEIFIYSDSKLIIIPFEKHIKAKTDILDTFIIKKLSYINYLDDIIIPYINYFIANYDEDRELILSYFKLKYMIDNKKKRMNQSAFIKLLYTVLFTDSMKRKIEQMVEDNYYIDISGKKDIKYDPILEFTVDHAKAMMKISIAIKLMVPIVFHYINTANLIKKAVLFDYYEDLFDLFDPHIDLYVKLKATVDYKLNQHYGRNKTIWEQREIMGEGLLNYGDKLLKKHIIEETMFKYVFNKNIVSFNSVILDQQLVYYTIVKYDHTRVQLDNKKDAEGLSGLDKLEMNSFKIDESLVILSDVNIKETIKKIRKSMKIDLPKAEIDYYKDNYVINKFQVQLVYYYYAKYFGGYRDLNLLTRKQYLKLLVLLKRRLQIQGLVYLPQIITGNIEKLNKRAIQNSKFLSKIESSNIYQNLVQEKFNALEELNKEKMIIGLLSTINNSKFTIVDYDHPEKLGQELEIHNTDILSDEFLHFLNQI